MHKRLWITSSLAIAAGAPASALAQESGSRLEEVVVTAERRAASLQEVPVAVSALDIEGLDNRMVQEAEDLQRFVPSLKMTNNITAPNNLSPSMRGSTVQDASLVVAESPFGIYIDDVYVGRMNGNNVTLADIERVEVLRGPQGTLYGRNTLAGAIKFVTRDPGEEPWLNASIGAGNWDQYRVSVSAGMPFNDSWAGSIAGQITEKDGQFNNVVEGGELGLERNYAVRGKLRYMGSDTFDAVAMISWVRSESDALQQPPGIPSVPADQVFTSDDIVPFFGDYNVGTLYRPRSTPLLGEVPNNNTEQLIASLNLSWDIGPGTLRSITAYVKNDDYFMTDFSGGLQPALGLPGSIVGASDPVTDQYSQEIQFQGEAFDARLDYIVGAYFFREEAEQGFGWQFFTQTSTSRIFAETDSIAFFGQLNYDITDRLKATVGLRWVEDEKDFDIRFRGFPATSFLPVPLADRVQLNESYSETTPRFGLDYTFETGGFVDEAMVYASAARGFKSGGFNGIAIFNLNDARNPYFPETNWTYELGIKTDMFDNRVRVNAVLFSTETEDAQLNATLNGGQSFPVQNAGDVAVDGLEFDITWVPLDGLTLFANAALMDSEFKNLDPNAAPAQAPILYNNNNPTPPQTPDYTYAVGFDYRIGIPLGPDGSELMFGADYFSSDDYFVQATNDFIISAYDRVGAYAGLAYGDNWEFRLSARNLTDETDIISGSRGLSGFIYLPQREWMFTVNYRQ